MYDIGTTITDPSGNSYTITDRFYKKCSLSALELTSVDDGRVSVVHVEESEGMICQQV